jgi:transcriptional regulator with GAF, ATPase, and Fis domain
MIGATRKILIVFEWIRTAAKSGISGAHLGRPDRGKEVVARMIHELSAAQPRNFQAVNCAALPGHAVRVGNLRLREGRLHRRRGPQAGPRGAADRGTLFLDEVGDLSLVAQAKLLRVLEDGGSSGWAARSRSRWTSA